MRNPKPTYLLGCTKDGCKWRHHPTLPKKTTGAIPKKLRSLEPWWVAGIKLLLDYCRKTPNRYTTFLPKHQLYMGWTNLHVSRINDNPMWNPFIHKAIDRRLYISPHSIKLDPGPIIVGNALCYNWIFQFVGAEWMCLWMPQQKPQQRISLGSIFWHPKLEVIGMCMYFFLGLPQNPAKYWEGS